ncbi:MAG: hypothetical protein IJU10_03300 [Clostridia bacterium]|nr:hypothetical protein [Clostridia bacterium]
MKKFWIILPIVIVVVAATVFGLYAAGVFGKDADTDEPISYAMSANAAESGIFRELSADTYFDIKAPRKPNNENMDNYVLVTDRSGGKVTLKTVEADDLPAGVYRVTARDGFKERTTYRIRVFDASFVAEEYKDLTTFIFTTKGTNKNKAPVVKQNASIVETDLTGTDVQTLTQNGDTTYYVTLANAATERFAPGTVFLAKKPDEDLFDSSLSVLYNGEIAGYAYNGMAAYVVLEESKVKDGKEEIHCRLAQFNEVVSKADIYQDLVIDENNFSFDEDALRDALENSEFAEALLVTAQETFDLFSKDFVVNEGNGKAPRQVVTFDVNLDGSTIKLNIKYTITIVKGVDIVVGINNDIKLTPSLNCDYDSITSIDDLSFDFSLKIDTKTTCYVKMNTNTGVIKAESVDDFKEKFVELLKGNTAEKAIVGTELPIYSYKYPIYCFVLGIEFGVDLNFGITGDLSFEYIYNTEIVAGVTYVDGEFTSYKSMETSSKANDLVLLGKVTAEAGVYVKLTASVLEVVGIGFKVKVGAYAEIGGQLRLDMEAALNKELHIIKGYYVTGGLYLGADFQVKAGVELPVLGYKGVEKTWELAKLKYPLFEFGSRYLVKDILDDGKTVQIPGKSVEFKEINVNAFDLYSVKDATGVKVGLDNFDVVYVDDAADYITLKDGLVTVKPTVGTEFNAVIELISKSDDGVKGRITFHKTAVMPTCDEPTAIFDKADPDDVVFDVALNESAFIGLTSPAGAVQYAWFENAGELAIHDTFLNKLPLGEHVFTFKSNKGVLYLTVTVVDTTPITVNSAKANYSKKGESAVNFKLELHGNKIASIEGLDDSQYTVDNSGSLKIFAPVFADKEPDDYDYVVTAANGTTVTLTVTVKDDREPGLYSKMFGFSKTTNTNDVKVTFEKFAYRFDGVSGNGITENNYTEVDGGVIISKDYLMKQPEGEYKFYVTFVGDIRTSKEFTVRVWENASIVAGTSYAVFDKNAPADVSYTVYATSKVTLTSTDCAITAKAYTTSGNTVTLSKSFLAGLAVGEYTLSANAGTMNADLKLKVIDTTVPVIALADGGKLVLTYDKSAGVAPAFDLTLGGAALDTVEGIGYTFVTDNGVTKVTLDAAELQALALGEYEYNVLTTVNRMTLVVKVIDSAVPEAIDRTTVAYKKGSLAPISITFDNHGYDVVSLEVTGSDAPALGEYSFDKDTGVFSLTGAYLDTLTDNEYTTFALTFNNEAATVLKVTVSVS